MRKFNDKLFKPDMKLLFKVLCWIQTNNGSVTVDLNEIRPLLSQMSSILESRGKHGLILWCKNHRLALLHYLSGESKEKKVQGVRLSSDGFPVGLRIKKSLVSEVLPLRLILTVLFSTRALALGKSPDFNPITAPNTNNNIDLVTEINVRDFWEAIGFRKTSESPRFLKFKGKFPMTSKAGPNGHALFKSLSDLKVLQDNYPDLLRDIISLGGKKLESSINWVLDNWESIPEEIKTEGVHIRKLAWFPDSELKVRVVGELDYYSQVSLKPLHDYLFRVLRQIPQDCTFNQGKFTESYRKWDWYESIDLTAATDRFPISFICRTLRGILPNWYVDSWERVMVQEPFYSQDGYKTYASGNPMGAYSSWNSFTVAHHFVMKLACDNIGIRWREAPYAMLGDDVLIGHRELAVEYKKLIRSLGVDFSPIKSHSSSRLFEFAKRLFLDGSEISPFPISALSETSQKFYLLTSLMMEEERKGWVWLNGIAQSVSSFYRIVCMKPSKYCKVLEQRSDQTDLILRYIRGLLPAESVVNTLIGRYGSRLGIKNIVLDSHESERLLHDSFTFVLLEKDPFGSKGDGRDLNILGTRLMLSTRFLLETKDMSEAIGLAEKHVPIMSVIKQTIQTYVDLASNLVNLSRPSDVVKAIKALTIPISDKVFTEREKFTVSRAASVLGDSLTNVLRDKLKARDFWGPDDESESLEDWFHNQGKDDSSF